MGGYLLGALVIRGILLFEGLYKGSLIFVNPLKVSGS